jgi:hypothetical protein
MYSLEALQKRDDAAAMPPSPPIVPPAAPAAAAVPADQAAKALAPYLADVMAARLRQKLVA